MTRVVSFISGLIFGLGLLLAGMTNPAKVKAFLDVGGLWDPSLAFVMIGAIALAMPAFRWTRSRSVSLLGEPMCFPINRALDRRLIGGSLIFGIGWGLAGICPGPAIVLLGAAPASGAIFVVAMLVGMALCRAFFPAVK